jgi:hypothetical protein
MIMLATCRRRVGNHQEKPMSDETSEPMQRDGQAAGSADSLASVASWAAAGRSADPPLFVPEVHPRIAARQLEGPPLIADTAVVGGPVARVNARFGLGITIAVGSMWAAYLFTSLALISLPSAIRSRDLIVIISWIAQTFLQLVLLPIIMVGQNVQGAASDRRAQSTFDDTEALLHINQQLQAHMHAQDAAIVAILEALGVSAPPSNRGDEVGG